MCCQTQEVRGLFLKELSAVEPTDCKTEGGGKDESSGSTNSVHKSRRPLGFSIGEAIFAIDRCRAVLQSKRRMSICKVFTRVAQLLGWS
jgi:hypothetical protein